MTALKAFSEAKQGSQEFFTQLDILFGKNIKAVLPRQLDAILCGFVRSGKYRQKLLVLL